MVFLPAISRPFCKRWYDTAYSREFVGRAADMSLRESEGAFQQIKSYERQQMRMTR